MRNNRDPYQIHRTRFSVPLHRTAPVVSRQRFPRFIGWLGVVGVALIVLSILHAILKEVL